MNGSNAASYGPARCISRLSLGARRSALLLVCTAALSGVSHATATRSLGHAVEASAAPRSAAPAVAPPANANLGQTLRLAVQLEPPGLDPTINPAAPIGEIVYGNLYEGLVRFDAHGGVLPALAESWQISSDGREYLFRLRTGVKFHDGTHFDASIARFSLERARSPDSGNPQRDRLSSIERIETPDEHTVRLMLSRPSASLLPSLAWAAFVMVTPASAATNGVRPVGTGPFRFVAWRRGDSIEIRRNEHYWGRSVSLDRVQFRFIAEPAAAYSALMARDIDAFPNYPAPESVAQFRADPRFRVFVGSTEGETVLAFNQRKAPFDRLEVRQAICHALDRRAIIDGAMFGLGEPIGSHFPPHAPDALDLTGVCAHDVARARELLAHAGFAHGFTVRLALPPPSYARRSGEIVAAQLAAVGIQARIENIEWAQWLDRIFSRHDFDMTIVQHAEPADFDIYARDDYYFGYSNPDFKALLASFEASTSASARQAALQAVQRKLADDAVNAFLFQYPKLAVFDAHVHGLATTDPLNTVDLRDVSMDSPASRGPTRFFVLPSWIAVALGCGVLLGLVALAFRWDAAFVARRAVILVATLLASSAVIFCIVQVAPGDPARVMLGLHADDAGVARVRHELRLDAPAPARYLEWIAGLAHGDFGTSYTYRVPVSSLIVERAQVSVPLALYALALTVVISFPAGLLSVMRGGRGLDHFITASSQLGMAVPNFWLGILLIWVFAVNLRWVSAGGFAGWNAGFMPAIKSLTLPAIALALPQAAILTRIVRTSLLEVLQEDFMRTARAKGLSRFSALLRHALPNAMVNVMTVLGLQLTFLLAGAVVIENVFFLPGLGRLVLTAVEQRDLMVVQSVVVLLVAAVLIVSFAVDLSYLRLDPRLRQRRL